MKTQPPAPRIDADPPGTVLRDVHLLLDRFQRPQFHSYPNIQALYLLLRTTVLLRVERAGTTAKLAVDAASDKDFCTLNPTEQFGSLLDAWLIKSNGAGLTIFSAQLSIAGEGSNPPAPNSPSRNEAAAERISPASSTASRSGCSAGSA